MSIYKQHGIYKIVNHKMVRYILVMLLSLLVTDVILTLRV